MSVIVTEKQKMDILSCMIVGGEYDAVSGECMYKVKINDNGEKEFLNGNGGR